MRLVDVVPARFHGITKEFAKFGTIGVINVMVNFAVLTALLNTVLHNSEVKAKAVATIVATTSAYFMNRQWTYRDRPRAAMRREYTLFFATNLVGLLIEAGTVWLTKYGLHQTSPLAIYSATAVGIGVGTVFRFWAYRTHVFKAAEAELEAPELEAPVAALVGTAPANAQPDQPAALAPVSPAPRIVVTSAEGGVVVLKVLEPAFEPA